MQVQVNLGDISSLRCPSSFHGTETEKQNTQAAARQQKFDTSAVGKAARKAVDDVKQERAAPRQGADRSQDWLS